MGGGGGGREKKLYDLPCCLILFLTITGLPVTEEQLKEVAQHSGVLEIDDDFLELACVAVVFVSFKPSGASARGHWEKRSKKVGAGGRGGEGMETPAAEPRHFTERPQMASLPWGLHCHVKCHMRTNQRKQNRGGQLVYFKLQYSR